MNRLVTYSEITVPPESTHSPPPPSRLGLFDLQVNGYAGVDFQRSDLTAEALDFALARLHARQIRAVLPTFVTNAPDALRRQLEQFEFLCERLPLASAMVPGYHLEGPWLNSTPGYCGAHPAEFMSDPDPVALQALHQAANGRLRLLTLAPERPGAIDTIQAARDLGIVVSLGHTNASEAEIDAAIRAGATLCTHLGNGVPASLPRHDNIVQRLLCRDELTACFIPDGHHLPPFALRNYIHAKPTGKVLLTSDAMAAADAPAGLYTLGGLTLEVGADAVVRQPNSPLLAGSALVLADGVARAARWLGRPLEDVWSLASSEVARALGLPLPPL